MRPVSAKLHISEENLYFTFAGHKLPHVPISRIVYILHISVSGPQGTLATTRNILVITTSATGVWRAEARVLLPVARCTGRPPASERPGPRRQGPRELSPAWGRRLLSLRTFSSHMPQPVASVYRY